MTSLFGCEAEAFEKVVFSETSKIAEIKIVSWCGEDFRLYFLSPHLKFMLMFEYYDYTNE